MDKYKGFDGTGATVTATNAIGTAYRWHWQLGRLLKQRGDTAGAIAAYDAAIDELQFLRNGLVTANREVQFSFRDSVEPICRQSDETRSQTIDLWF